MEPLNKDLVAAIVEGLWPISDRLKSLSQQVDTVKSSLKADRSPVTDADLEAHQAIVELLAVLTPAWPVISEESSPEIHQASLAWETYWLVDPLDGTKEFLSGSGEFTVNLALMVEGRPFWGIVTVPCLDVYYEGGKTWGTRKGLRDSVRSIQTRQLSEPCVVLGSRRHGVEALDLALSRLSGKYELRSAGSSYKFCLIAEGAADWYPRFSPTCEWDIAAGMAVLEGAGGWVQTLAGHNMRYHQPNRLNPHFVAGGDIQYQTNHPFGVV
jgi:3'(2'), 5'-bisphosphate nucleotidase